MNELANLDTNNYEAMAKAMGMSSLAVPTKEKSKLSCKTTHPSHTIDGARRS
tara:strand:- start:910 stop:1065 length:156 start_codon:yes stop_codon:yes gene_type:complete